MSANAFALVFSVSILAACDAVPPEPPPLSQGVHGGKPDSAIVGPEDTYRGRSQIDWAIEHARWALSVPLDQSPFTDGDGRFCEVNQQGPVWNLDGSNGAAFHRSCRVPEGRALSVPVAYLFNDHPCPDPSFGPAPGQSLEDFLTEGAVGFMDTYTTATFELDGVEIPDVMSYRHHSGLFHFTGDPSLTALDPCVTGRKQEAVVDGFWMLVKPLDEGHHSIKLTSTTNWGQSTSAEWDLDVEGHGHQGK